MTAPAWWWFGLVVMLFLLAWEVQLLAWVLGYDVPYGYCLPVAGALLALLFDAVRKWWP